ncbi:uncharacterized protein LAJ45_01072 [Morchella importuna]|uniref:uncharacterized protein n=1 Tax=Morchella importuna TaxID=1174673 RepID=UPI001E8DA1B0|nr:uncharacterized protein LAJ45_01072 [Morchella importuna]KAH8154544.1 hypothetical protein LAJ45_01072 [Morchella importuna]
MAYATGLRQQACTPRQAMDELQRAHISAAQRLLSILSSTDFARNNWAIVTDVLDITRAVTENLRGYSTCSSSNYHTSSFRREAREFVSLHNDGFERNQNLLLHYHRYRGTLDRSTKSRLDQNINTIKEEQELGNDYCEEISEMMPR